MTEAMPASIAAKMHCLDHNPSAKKELWDEIILELAIARDEERHRIGNIDLRDNLDKDFTLYPDKPLLIKNFLTGIFKD